MTDGLRQRFADAASFLLPEIRRGLSRMVSDRLQDLPKREVALLSCDIVGFSAHSSNLLAQRADGVELLHRQLQSHYEALVSAVIAHGGEPITFIGDCLLSLWDMAPDDPAQAVRAAAALAQQLAEQRKAGGGHFDLNLHVVTGGLRTIEVGGISGRWLGTHVGPVLRALQDTARTRLPNEVLLSTEAAQLCGAVTAPLGEAHHLLERLTTLPLARQGLALPDTTHWGDIIARTPRYVSRWIERVGLEWIAELRPVTALTIALVDFDDTHDNAASRLDAITQAVQEIIHGRDGSIDAVLVDEKGVSLLAFFGTPPDAHSDDPLRGVLSGREIVERLGGMGVDVSVGISLGRAFCGIVGTPDRRGYLVSGDLVNLSARLAWASTGGVLVDEAVRAATRTEVAYRDAPVELTLKGQPQAIPAWTLAARVEYRGRLGAIAGRDAEVAMLRRLWAEAHEDRRGNCVIVEGESGTGKTSLSVEIWRQVEATGGVFRVATATAVDRETPFSALRRLMMDVLGVSAALKLEDRGIAVLANLPPALHPLAPLLDAVFPSGLSENARTSDIQGQARTEAIENLLIEVLHHAFGSRSVCLCIDDAQWLDLASARLLSRLLNRVSHLLLVIFAQPSADQRWMDDLVNEGAHRLRLPPLNRAGVIELIRHRLGVREVDEALLGQVMQIAQGHPFFAAELISSMEAKGNLRVEGHRAILASAPDAGLGALPETLHGMILQRLDRPEPEQQLTGRVAAVAGLVFPTRIVCDIHPTETGRHQAHRHLLALSKLSIIEPLVAVDLPGYGFRLKIVRDIAYGQLPRQERMRLHRRAAEWIETHSGAERANRLLEIADHWDHAGEASNAIDCLLEEALRLFRQGFALDAVKVGLKAIRIAGVTPPQDSAARQAAIGATLGKVMALLANRTPIELVAAGGPPSADLALKLKAILTTAPFAFQSNQFEIFAWAATEAMRQVAEAGTGPPHAFSMYSIVLALLTGDRAGAAAWSRAALDLDAAMGGAALPAVGFIDSWFHAHWRDPLSHSIERTQRAAQRALADGDHQYASYNISGEVVMRGALGQPLADILATAESALTHAIARNSRLHVILERQFARAMQGKTHSLTSLGDAETHEQTEIDWVMGSELINQIGFVLTTRMRLHIHAGNFAEVLALDRALAPVAAGIANQVAEPEAVFHRALARLALLMDGIADADAMAQVAADLAQMQAWRVLSAENFGMRADILQTLSDALSGDRAAAALRLVQIATLPPGAAPEGLGDRALALAFASRLDPAEHWRKRAAQAYTDWGATAIAWRFL